MLWQQLIFLPDAIHCCHIQYRKGDASNIFENNTQATIIMMMRMMMIMVNILPMIILSLLTADEHGSMDASDVSQTDVVSRSRFGVVLMRRSLCSVT